jgi:RNA polymerase sigma-70 factor (ECF subfamily)
MKIIQLHQDEKNWIEQAVQKNRHAQHQLYKKFAPKMLGVCRQYVKDLQQAEDVMITAFMKVFTQLHTFEFKGSFEGWIRKIMVNEAISFLRVQKETYFSEDVNVSEDSWDDINHQINLDQIQSKIDALPDGYRMIFNLYVIEGYKHHEIAKMLGIQEGTSKSQLSQARKMLQKLLVQPQTLSHEIK